MKRNRPNLTSIACGLATSSLIACGGGDDGAAVSMRAPLQEGQDVPDAFFSVHFTKESAAAEDLRFLEEQLRRVDSGSSEWHRFLHDMGGTEAGNLFLLSGDDVAVRAKLAEYGWGFERLPEGALSAAEATGSQEQEEAIEPAPGVESGPANVKQP